MLYSVTNAAPIRPTTRRTLSALAELLVDEGLVQSASVVVDFLGTGRGLTRLVRTLSATEWQAADAADEDDSRWERVADACGEAVRLVLIDYEDGQ